MRRIGIILIAGVALSLGAASAVEQRTDVFVASRDHPAIAYSSASTSDPIATLNEQLRLGSAKLAFAPSTGFLLSTLQALRVPVESQSLVFSETSAQASRINPANPRALYFNDTSAVGWVRGGETLEVAAQDARQGFVFYSIEQKPTNTPQFVRDNSCLLCHLSWDTLGVPGPLVISTFPMSDDPNAYASGTAVDHRTPLTDRWGGWYVTGNVGSVQHLGNRPVFMKDSELQKPRPRTPQLDTVRGQFDISTYPTACSDAVALMVLDHQAHMTNLITRLGWEARVALFDAPSYGNSFQRAPASTPTPSRVTAAANDLVDYLLFVDEASLPARVQGSCGFSERFTAQGLRDSKGRTLRDFDLEHRMMRYPCSYMIYTPAFDSLPPVAKDAVYARMWRILSGEERTAKYARLSVSDRRAIVEILRETKSGLPVMFRDAIR